MESCTALRAVEAGYLQAIKSPHAAGFIKDFLLWGVTNYRKTISINV
nr:hypothetical protein [Rahnella sp. RFA10(1/100)]